jgi:hypothetical protein
MTHKRRVLELLADGVPHPHTEGYRLGVMLHSRVSDLRKDGHTIVSWRDGDTYMYQLLGSSLEDATLTSGVAAATLTAITAAAASPSSPGVASSSEAVQSGVEVVGADDPPVNDGGLLDLSQLLLWDAA